MLRVGPPLRKSGCVNKENKEKHNLEIIKQEAPIYALPEIGFFWPGSWREGTPHCNVTLIKFINITQEAIL